MHLSIRPSNGRRGSWLASMALAIAATVVIAAPVAAATPPTSDYGNTAECRYKTSGNGPAYDWWLKRFVVRAPVLYAKKPHQTVGWRFVVTRSIWYEGQGPLTVTYRSPIQKRTATPTTPASFEAQGVDVTLPNIENKKRVQYFITLNLFWYRADGKVGSQQTYLMPWLKTIQAGHYYGDYAHDCWGGFYEGP